MSSRSLHGLVHLAPERIGHAAVGLGGLQVLEDVAQLLEQALGLGHVAAAHGVFHLLQHAVEIVLRDHPVRRALVLVLRLLLVLLHALGEFAQELVHGLAQLVREAPDLVIRRAAVHGLLQALLGGAQFALRVGEAAVLDLQRHGPEPVGHIEQVLVGPGDAQALARRRAGP